MTGPSDEARAEAHTEVYGEARNAAGDVARVFLTTPEGYTLTADASLVIAQRVLDGEVEPGATTPAKAFGGGLIDGLSGVISRPVEVVRANP
jgi:saccharopine dehydrogenase (NAD+, L-lysine-forming)